MAMKAAKN